MSISISVIIVGGGLAGLATAIGLQRAGHQVTVLEKSPVLGQIGAGIQIPPNSAKVFKGWGLLDELEKLSITPNVGVMRSYREMKPLSILDMGEKLVERYGTPYLLIHRVDLHHLLAKEAERVGVEIRLGVEVTGIETDTNSQQGPLVHIANGEQSLSADLVFAADGERSRCRGSLLGHEIPWKDSGDHVLRATVPVQILQEDDELREFVNDLNFWVGPESNALTYSLKRDGLFNVVTTGAHAPDAAIQFAPKLISQEEALLEFPGWDPLFHRLLRSSTMYARWTLLHTDMPSKWTNETGNVSLIGDAAHAMLPYTGQGAAMAFEDAATIGVLLSSIKDKKQIPDLLTIYETIRRPRVTEMHRRVKQVRDIYSMADGPKQQERDRQLREQAPFDGYPNFLADPVLQEWMFSYDAFKVAQKALDRFRKGEFPGTQGTWRLYV
ncbi:FAD binding domain-containing protein [Penicillium frequentans]|nr:FAD binding domain-containing protein [Penicillium glabrum]